VAIKINDPSRRYSTFVRHDGRVSKSLLASVAAAFLLALIMLLAGAPADAAYLAGLSLIVLVIALVRRKRPAVHAPTGERATVTAYQQRMCGQGIFIGLGWAAAAGLWYGFIQVGWLHGRDAALLLGCMGAGVVFAAASFVAWMGVRRRAKSAVSP
jgi:hypothetical protein